MLFIATSNSLIRVVHECLPAVRQVKALVLKITESRSTLFTRVLEPGGTGRRSCCQRNDPDRVFRNEHSERRLVRIKAQKEGWNAHHFSFWSALIFSLMWI